MPTRPLTDAQCREAAALYAEHKSKEKAARAIDLSPKAFRHRLARAAERGFCGTEPVLPGFAISQTTAKYDKDGKLSAEYVQQRRAPGEAFTLLAGHIVKGESALVDAEGRTKVKWIKTKTDTATPDLVAALTATFKAYKGRAKLIGAPRRTARDLLCVYPIADQHVGLLSWHRETGENYDLKIGIARLRESMLRLVAQSPAADRAVILNLGDWQHNDDRKNMTPKSGNILDVDGRYVKVLEAGVRLMMDCIELALQKHRRVLVVNIEGNHDPHASIALTLALQNFYRRNPRVEIAPAPSPFFFHRFGAVLIGATHGHRLKPADMAMTLAVRRRADWGATKFHYFYFGHIHHETAKEVGDVRVESFQTLAAKDAHASGAGYNSGQSLTAITHHRRDGEIGRHRINIFAGR
jgi:hypothetical protein